MYDASRYTAKQQQQQQQKPLYFKCMGWIRLRTHKATVFSPETCNEK